MSWVQDPEFLTREIIDTIHEETFTKKQIDIFGGAHGLRDENALESAIAAAQNVYHCGGGGIFEIAAAYGFHISESQAFLDGNKRTGVQAALVFLEGCAVDARSLPEDQTYEVMMNIAAHTMGRADLAEHFRRSLSPDEV